MGQALATRTLASPAAVLPHGKTAAQPLASKKHAKKSWLRKHAADSTPQLVAHLGSIKRRNTASFAEDADRTALLQSAIAELTDDMESLREARPDAFNSTISQLLEERSAPMLLLDAKELEGRGRLPCYDEVEAKLLNYSEVGPDDTVVFISHRWYRPGVPDGLHGEKVAIVRDIIKQQVAPKSAGGRVLLWWDFFSIAQKAAEIHTAVKGAQILAIPFYLAAADTLIALRGGDESSYAPEVLSRPDKGQLHAGRYDNRVWTMLELFGFTSDFAILCHERRFHGRARPRRLIDCSLSCEAERLVATAVDADAGKLDKVRSALHDTPGWTLPPGDNLTDTNDLRFIQPMVIALATESASATEQAAAKAQAAPVRAAEGGAAGGTSLARLLRTASSFGFEHAVSSFVELMRDQRQLEAEIDAEDDAGHTALSRAVFANQPEIVQHLLRVGADVTKVHPKLHTTALHLALSLRRFRCAAPLLDAYEARGLALPVDQMGRTAVHVAASSTELSLNQMETATTLDEPKIALIERLLRMGVDPTARDHSHRTALDLLHAANHQQTLAAVEALLSDEQRTACLPRTTVTHPVELPRVARIARRSIGRFTPPARAHGASYTFDTFEPAHGGAKGPTVLLIPFAHDEAQHELMELLVGQFNATCHLLHLFTLDLAPEYRKFDGCHPHKGVWGAALVADHMEQFIDTCCGGHVDCAMGWCRPGEWLARVAVAAPQKIGSLVLTATPAAPPADGEEEQMGDGIRAMLASMPDAQVGQCMLQHGAPSFAAAERQAISEHYGKVVFDSWLLHARDQGTFEPDGWWEEFCRNTRYWRHWNKIEQPLLLVAGADDASFLVGMENLVALVPNGSMEWIAGVAHMPFVEAPSWYRSKVLGFVGERGFARMHVEEL